MSVDTQRTQIDLYNVEFKKSNNFCVEDLEDYLDTLTPSTMYFPIPVNILKEMNIKLDLVLERAWKGHLAKSYNYCRIRCKFPKVHGHDDGYFYYFIDGMEFIAEKSIRLKLSLDVLNTFVFWTDTYHDYTQLDYQLSDKSLLEREHRNRWTYIAIQGQHTWYRHIHKLSEDNIAVKYQTQNEIINQDSQCWYLVYRNKNAIDPTDYTQVNPVDKLLIPKIPFTIKSYNIQKQASDITAYTRVFARGVVYPTITATGISQDPFCLISSDTYYRWIEAHGNDIKVYDSYYSDGRWYHTLYASASNNPYVYIGHLPFNTYGMCFSNAPFDPSIQTMPDTTPTGFWSGTSAPDVDVVGISQLDRTDSRLIKVIELPYAPCMEDPKYIFGIPYNFLEHDTLNNKYFIYITDLSFELNGNISWESNFFPDSDIIDTLDDEQVETFVNNLNENSYDDYIWMESKLYHSDYCQIKFLYDSFSYDLQAELLDIHGLVNDGDTHHIKIIPSSNFSSSILFKFDFALRDSQTDYDNLLISTRNNELPIFSSAYLNYVRNGYNYDQKAKSLSLASSMSNIAMSTGAGLVGGAMTGGGVGAVVGAVGGFVSGVTNTIFNQISQQNNIEAKLQQSKNQAVSIQTSDDLSLMNYYTNGNKLRALQYEASNEMRYLLLAKFHYFGYQVNQEQAPDMYSRYWFNFAKGNMILKDVKNIAQDMQDEIIKKWNEGVTLLHKHNFDNVDTWDFNQSLLNLETIMVNSVE